MNDETINLHVDDLYRQGFTAIPGLYDAEECQQMRELMDDFWRSQGSPSLGTNGFGFNIHPMVPQLPAIVPFLDRVEPLAIIARALRDDVRLVHLGARISGPMPEERIGWHNHYASNGDGPPNAWDAETIPRRERIERLLGGIYVDGTMPETGTFIALPRGYRDPLGAPLGSATEIWPGEVHVALPPGSFAIFDTALWHAARRGTGNGTRRLWGAHFQGWHDPRPHPEDNAVNVPEISTYLSRSVSLNAIIAGSQPPPR